ncbi:pilus assembly protein [Neisseria gonorrhoeae]|uniref:pilus assembly PilX family protein n=1 Tax=Neisseria gonorrhoeae TaxID=485 RepID=UPI0005E8B169|nr:pilus assembly protein [Neisseria gonorrhoeae]KLS05238.1 pilus assembly protein PilX [Neisseria gonorrhoeae ATL_2011_01_08]KLS22016.1 pilus assembly protein PilX [Neisseria gonorrhoeae SK36809]KLS49955.1 pilus assembly protein PilX [Neisseria gonorrhoeae MIA_2011_03-10]KLT05386.1 pilus assembly protein PilX [Neisseria gonorrhoeae MU_NG26]MBT8020506.1 pilus assembly protein [Neisseria gonorrhoeae]
MRKQNTLTGIPTSDGQRGSALFIVLMVMIVVAFLVVTAAQSYNTEQRISANESDRKLALSLAEAALREGEFQVLDLEYTADSKVTFSENCENGLCTAVNVRTNDANEETFDNIVVKGKPTVEAVKRPCPAKSGKNSTGLCIDNQGVEYKKGTGNVSKMPRYIIEYLGVKNGQNVYRVTAKAWGKNANTVVVLQSYVGNNDEQ